MQNITIGYVVGGLALLVGFIKGVTYLKKSIKEWITDLLKEPFDNLNSKLETMQEKIDEVDMGTCKNFLVARIAEVEKGNELDEIERERFWEQYEHYANIGGNSYIKRKVEELKAEGKL
jgi:hypothetical protein